MEIHMIILTIRIKMKKMSLMTKFKIRLGEVLFHPINY